MPRRSQTPPLLGDSSAEALDRAYDLSLGRIADQMDGLLLPVHDRVNVSTARADTASQHLQFWLAGPIPFR